MLFEKKSRYLLSSSKVKGNFVCYHRNLYKQDFNPRSHHDEVYTIQVKV